MFFEGKLSVDIPLINRRRVGELWVAWGLERWRLYLGFNTEWRPRHALMKAPHRKGSPRPRQNPFDCPVQIRAKDRL